MKGVHSTMQYQFKKIQNITCLLFTVCCFTNAKDADFNKRWPYNNAKDPFRSKISEYDHRPYPSNSPEGPVVDSKPVKKSSEEREDRAYEKDTACRSFREGVWDKWRAETLADFGLNSW